MRLPIRKPFVGSVLLAAVAGSTSLALTEAGCSSRTGSPEPAASNGSSVPSAAATDNTGSVGLQLQLPGGVGVNTASWTITGPNGASTVVQTGTVNVQNSQSISFLVGGIPVGSGYTVTLNATATDGVTSCVGSGTFSTTARTTTAVTVLLQCTQPPSEAGSVQINGSAYSCASVSSIAASPSEVNVGATAALSATASGPGADGGAISYAWSAPSGTFDTPNAANANFSCTTAGPVTVTLTVTDGLVPDGGACNPALSTQSVTIQCDALVGQALVTSLGAGVFPTTVVINQGTAIGEGCAQRRHAVHAEQPRSRPEQQPDDRDE